MSQTNHHFIERQWRQNNQHNLWIPINSAKPRLPRAPHFLVPVFTDKEVFPHLTSLRDHGGGQNLIASQDGFKIPTCRVPHLKRKGKALTVRKKWCLLICSSSIVFLRIFNHASQNNRFLSMWQTTHGRVKMPLPGPENSYCRGEVCFVVSPTLLATHRCRFCARRPSEVTIGEAENHIGYDAMSVDVVVNAQNGTLKSGPKLSL